MSSRVSVKDVSMVDVFKKLDDLTPLSEALNRESEDLNDIIQKIQERLAKLSLGVEASVLLYEKKTTWLSQDEETEEPACEMTWLSYQRPSGNIGRWGLYIVEQINLLTPGDIRWIGDVVSENSPRRLLDSSRAIRIDALAKIPELIDELQCGATEKLEKLRKAKSEISE